MQSKVVNVCFSIAFVVFLLVPLFFADLQGGSVSEAENRVLAVRPSFSLGTRSPTEFVAAFDAWFADNLGFRDGFIRLHRRLDMLETGGQYQKGTTGYLIGQQGHHFNTGENGVLIKKFQGNAIFSQEQLETLAQKLNAVDAVLRGKEIPFVMMVCTDKESIYPEFYPRSIVRGPEPNQLDVVISYLDTHTTVDDFSNRQRLLLEKEKYPIFLKVGEDLTHYTRIGSFFAYCDLMEHICKYFPDMIPLTEEDVECIPDDVMPDVILKNEIPYQKLDASFFDGVEVKRPFTWEEAAFQQANATDPKIMILCDSHTAWKEKTLAYYLTQSFGTVICIHYDNISHLEQFLDTYEPDLVLFEVGERGLGDFYAALSGLEI